MSQGMTKKMSKTMRRSLKKAEMSPMILSKNLLDGSSTGDIRFNSALLGATAI